jgi:LPXTG-motif cell wall-anchored protein
MRQAAVVGITLAVIMVFGQVLVSNVGVRADYARAATLSADDGFGPALQTTATTTAASPAASPGALPEAGASSSAYLILLGAIILIVLGASAVLVTSSRRGNQT